MTTTTIIITTFAAKSVEPFRIQLNPVFQ